MEENENTRSFVNLTAGTKVSHYKIISKIGAGGMGEVYLAKDSKLSRQVALKFLPYHMCSDAASRSRFTREAKASAKLDHPNIVPVYEVDEFQGRPFFAMAHIEGSSLREVIKQGKLSIADAIRYTMQICDGLNNAHSEGIVHRDIKPANIIIDKDNRPRILDFGLATVTGEEKLTKTGSTLGTVGYMAPEQIEGKNIDHRSDLFSVGVILYEMLTGRRPFEGDNDAAIVRAITSSNPDPIARFKSGVTGELQQIVDKALTKDPSLRYQHADGMLSDLKRLSPSSVQNKKNRLSLWIVAAIVIVVGGYFLIDKYTNTDKTSSAEWINSVAVLPFRDLSRNQDQEYFCEGMADAIISRLTTIKGLKTSALTSVLRFKDEADLKKIARQLKVETILSGTILIEGDNVRIRTQLINVKDEIPIWSDSYDREMKSLFEIQDDISTTITEVLEIQLSNEGSAALVNQGTDNIEAYNAYIKGRHFWRKRNKETIYKAIEYFEKALELDPNYALAYVGLADCWLVMPDYINKSVQETNPIAKEFVLKALEIDINIGEAHATYGAILARDLEVKKAEKEFKKAISLNPGYPWTYTWYSGLYTDLLGKEDEGIKLLEKSIELDPLSAVSISNLAMLKRVARDYKAADEFNQRALEIEPNNIRFRVNYALYFTWVNEGDKALEQAKIALQIDSMSWRANMCMGAIIGYLGRNDEAIKYFEHSVELNPNNYLTHESFAIFYYNRYSSRFEDAMYHYKKAIELNPKAHISINGLSYIYAKIGEYEKAIETVNDAIEIAPFQPFYIDTRADIHAEFGFFDKAIKDYQLYFQKVITEKFDNETIIEMGRVCYSGQQYERADSLFKIISLDSDSTVRADGRFYLSQPLRHQGKFKQAIDSLRLWIEMDKNELGDSWKQMNKIYVIGYLYLEFIDDYKKAIIEFEKAAELVFKLDSTSYWINILKGRIAQSYASLGDTSKAYSLLEGLWKVTDTTHLNKLNSYYFYSGNTEIASNNYKAAIIEFEKYDGSSFSLNTTLGYCYLKINNFDGAVELLVKEMKRYDNNRYNYPERSVRCYYWLGMAYEGTGRTKDAIKQYEIFLNLWKNSDEGLKSIEDAKERLAKLKVTL